MWRLTLKGEGEGYKERDRQGERVVHKDISYVSSGEFVQKPFAKIIKKTKETRGTDTKQGEYYLFTFVYFGR